MNKVVIIFALVSVALAAELPAYTTPSYPSSALYEKKTYDYVPMPYDFAWTVKDEPSYNDYSHQERNDGKATTGSYRVVLPDGRTQIVTYKADEYGYVADVKYEGGQDKWAYKPTYPAEPAYPKPAYKPAYPAEPAYPKPAYPAEPAYPKPAYPKA